MIARARIDGDVAQWCNPLTLQPEQSDAVGSILGKVPLLERRDKGSRTRSGLIATTSIPELGTKNDNFTFTFKDMPIYVKKIEIKFYSNLSLICYFVPSFFVAWPPFKSRASPMGELG